MSPHGGQFMVGFNAAGRRREINRTNTGSGCEVSFVAHVAVAEERADGVDALAVPTRILQHLALVDVCRQRVRNPLLPRLRCSLCWHRKTFSS